MPATTTTDLIALAPPMPAALRADVEQLKARVEAIIDGTAERSGLNDLVINLDATAALLKDAGHEVQGRLLFAAASLADGACHDLYEALRHVADDQTFDAFDVSVSHVHDGISRALEAELKIHTPAPIVDEAA